MVEVLLVFIGSILMLIVICFIASLILAKQTKEFHISFGLFKGFEISGSFYKHKK